MTDKIRKILLYLLPMLTVVYIVLCMFDKTVSENRAGISSMLLFTILNFYLNRKLMKKHE